MVEATTGKNLVSPDLSEVCAAVGSAVCKTGRLMAITGAGVSMEAVAALRVAGLPEGLWHPLLHSDWVNDAAYIRRILKQIKAAALDMTPKDAHIAVGQLVRLCREGIVVTSNVDGLQQLVNDVDVIEFSGNMWRWRCDVDGYRREVFDTVSDVDSPTCICGRPMRPDIVLPNEPYDKSEYLRVDELLRKGSGVLMLIGTSGRNKCLKEWIDTARSHAWLCVEINPETTRLSEYCQIAVRMTAERVIPLLTRAVVQFKTNHSEAFGPHSPFSRP